MMARPHVVMSERDRRYSRPTRARTRSANNGLRSRRLRIGEIGAGVF